MHYEKEKTNLTYYYNVRILNLRYVISLNHDAKLRRFQSVSKYSCENFSDLLRRSGRDATNRLQAPKSCRKQNKIWWFQMFFLSLHQK